jgi:hypothetical protein
MNTRLESAKSSQDALSQFCEELSTPLEEVSNFVYLAARGGLSGNDSQRYLRLADKMLDDIRERVLTHCRIKHDSKRRAS